MWSSAARLDDYLRGRLERALDELAGIEPDGILSENVDVVVAFLLGKHMPTEISVDWDGATRTPVTEVTMQVRDQFDRNSTYTVPASRVVVSFPVSGTTEMLDYQASTFSVSGKYGKISGGNVQRLTASGLAPATVRYAHRVLSLILDHAVRDGRLPRNPASGVRLPRVVREEPAFLDHDQVDALAQACGRYGLLVRFLAYTGLRWGEAAALRVSRLDLLRRRVTVAAAFAEVRG